MKKDVYEYNPFLYDERGITKEEESELLYIRASILSQLQEDESELLYIRASILSQLQEDERKRMFIQVGNGKKDRKKARVRMVGIPKKYVPDEALDFVKFFMSLESENTEKTGDYSFFMNLEREFKKLVDVYVKR